MNQYSARTRWSGPCFAALAMITAATFAQFAGPEGSYDLSWYTIDGGGGTSSGGSFELTGTIGQPDAGVMTGGAPGNEFELVGGFWSTPGGTVPTCPADVAPPGGDGLINVDDLLAVISAWGPCPHPCLTDIAPPGGDGQVNVDDLLAVISAWGMCP